MRSQRISCKIAGIAIALLAPLYAVNAPEDRKSAADFTLTDARGNSVRLSNYRGKVVLLDFWATWCGGCKVEIPWYLEFRKKYKRNGLALLGVSLDEGGWKVVKPFLKHKKWKYTVVMGTDEVAKRYEVSSMPVTLLIDRDGKIAASHSGLVDKSAFESEIVRVLHESR